MDDPNPRWIELYQAALLELDRDKLLQYIELAERAIRDHANTGLKLVQQSPHDLRAMQNALRTLSMLLRNTLGE